MRPRWSDWKPWAAGLLLLAVFLRYSARRGEDFVYYYCAGRVTLQGGSPYEPGPYQSCIARSLGRANPNISAAAASAYPPFAQLPFGLLACLPYDAAFWAWNLLLAAAALASWRLLVRGPPGGEALWTGLLLMTSPGFVLGWGYHKLSLVLFPVMLWGMARLAREDGLAGPAALALLSCKPQVFAAAALFLLIHRRWKALAAATALALLLQLPFAALQGGPVLARWLASLSWHSQAILFFDNQSLFVSLYKPVRALLPGPTPALQALRYALSGALLLWTWRLLPRWGFTGSLAPYWALNLLALPYSTGADCLWAFPLFLAALALVQERTGRSAALVSAWGLGFNLLLALLAGGYAPASLSRIAYQYREGYLTLLLVLGWAAARLLLQASPRNCQNASG